MSAFDTAPPHSWKATSVATGEAPVLEALTDINAVSLARAELDPVTLLLVRIAALAAVDAPASYLMHLRPAVESNVTVEQRQDVLVAVAPIPGAPPRVLVAATNITEALGIAIAVTEAAAEADAGATSG